MTHGFQVYLSEVNLMNQLDPLVAEKIDFGQEGPTPNPYTIPSETRMTRTYSISTSDMNYEFWTCEWMIPYNDKSCIVEDRQLVRIRHVANVSHLISVSTGETLIICIKRTVSKETFLCMFRGCFVNISTLWRYSRCYA